MTPTIVAIGLAALVGIILFIAWLWTPGRDVIGTELPRRSDWTDPVALDMYERLMGISRGDPEDSL